MIFVYHFSDGNTLQFAILPQSLLLVTLRVPPVGLFIRTNTDIQICYHSFRYISIAILDNFHMNARMILASSNVTIVPCSSSISIIVSGLIKSQSDPTREGS